MNCGFNRISTDKEKKNSTDTLEGERRGGRDTRHEGEKSKKSRKWEKTLFKRKNMLYIILFLLLFF